MNDAVHVGLAVIVWTVNCDSLQVESSHTHGIHTYVVVMSSHTHETHTYVVVMISHTHETHTYVVVNVPETRARQHTVHK